MKVLASLSGAIAAGFLCFVIFALVSKYQLAQVGYTPNQSDKLIDSFIVVVPFAAFGGGWLSLYIYRRHLTKNSNGC